jgi:hypothetical protein
VFGPVVLSAVLILLLGVLLVSAAVLAIARAERHGVPPRRRHQPRDPVGLL